MAEEVMDLYKKVDKADKAVGKVKEFFAQDSTLSNSLTEAEKSLKEYKFKMIPKPNKNALTSGLSDLRSRLLDLAIYYFNPMTLPDKNSEIITEKGKIPD